MEKSKEGNRRISVVDRLGNEITKLKLQQQKKIEEEKAIAARIKVIQRGLDDASVDTIMRDIRDLFKYHKLILDSYLDEYFTKGTQSAVKHTITTQVLGISNKAVLSAGHSKGMSKALATILDGPDAKRNMKGYHQEISGAKRNMKGNY